MDDPFGSDRFGPPPGAIPAGNGFRYPDLRGDLHSSPQEAINANQGMEGDMSRGVSGGCSQDPGSIPDPRQR